MQSDVFFVNLRARNAKENKISKLKKLFDLVGMKNCIKENDFTAVKIHCGEAGSDGYINPIFVKPIVDKIKESGGKPFVTDTNTLYSGSRQNSVDHLNTASEHGFNPLVIGAPFIIADGLKSQYYQEIGINKKHFKTVKIAGDIVAADSMIVMSHFKGHEMAGFGGAIKNLAMGCAPAEGKKDQHSPRPFVSRKKCIGCRKCLEVCPAGAIRMEENISVIDSKKCIGCGECMTVCPVKAIRLNWVGELKDFTEKLTEYAYGAIQKKTNKVAFINFLLNITPDCDCVPWSDAPIVSDIGILASLDPVAIDQASLDLINKENPLKNTLLSCHNYDYPGQELFKSLHPNTFGEIQLSYGAEIGLGSRSYKLVEV